MQNDPRGPAGYVGAATGVESSVVRVVLLVLSVIAVAACGAYRFPGGGPPAGTGVVSGQVVVEPCAAVQPAAQPCKVSPMSGVEIDFSGDGKTIPARTDANGDYSVELSTGTWKVSFKGYLRIVKGPAAVTVRSGSRVVADYVVDSGIRAQTG